MVLVVAVVMPAVLVVMPAMAPIVVMACMALVMAALALLSPSRSLKRLKRQAMTKALANFSFVLDLMMGFPERRRFHCTSLKLDIRCCHRRRTGGDSTDSQLKPNLVNDSPMRN